MSEKLNEPAIEPLPAQLQVNLCVPTEGAIISPGGQISGIGWVISAAPVAGIDIQLGPERLGQARLGLSAEELSSVIDRAPSEAATGFVFSVPAPILPPGRITLRLLVETATARHKHDVGLTLAPERKPATPDPVRAMIETAAIDERGVLRVNGWAVSLAPLEQISVFLGERRLGEAQTGGPRHDVATVLPEYPNAASAGFRLHCDATEADLAEELVHVIVAAAGGVQRRFTAPLERPEQITPDAPDRFAKVDIEAARIGEDGTISVKGWAISAAGVADIRVEYDHELVGTTRPTEHRGDVTRTFPHIPGAARSGFRLRARVAPPGAGNHFLRVTVRGRDGFEDAATVTLQAEGAGAALALADAVPAIRYHLDAPQCRDARAIAPVRGFLSLNGWAFSPDGIAHVEVVVDGVSQGYAHYGVRREDLRQLIPEPDALRSGFAMVLPPRLFPRGEHAVRVVLRDKAARVQEIGFTVHAEPAADDGPGALRRKLPQAEIDLLEAILAARGHRPHWTILVLAEPAGADEAGFASALATTIDSFRFQAYADWSVIIAADSPGRSAQIERALAKAPADMRARIRLTPAPADTALSDLAEAGWLCVLALGDRLGEDALIELSVESAIASDADFLYCDELRLDPSDNRKKPFFKPDFSPDLLLGTNYIGRSWAASADLLARSGLALADLLSHGQYDAVLRLTEQARQIRHVPKVLCERTDRHEPAGRERRALTRAMQRRHISATLRPGAIAGSWRLQRKIAVSGRPAGLVSIIIPTIAAGGLIRTAITSIRFRTAWPAYEIICVDNIPRDGDAGQARWKTWIAANADRSLEIPGRFNWSRFNNRAARVAKGAFLLFLNDDIEVRDANWLHGLIEQAQRPEIGVVGPRLLYPDGRVQHAGVFLARSAARHAFRFYPADAPGPFGLALTQREVISVTGAAMMMRREVFDTLGGFNEAHPIINNDLDFNLRARRAGRSVIYTPAVSLIHHEQASRAALPDTHDARHFTRDWGDRFAQGDPFFSRHFSPDHDDHLPEPEKVRAFAAGHPLFARDKIRRILLVKVDHIGDFITAFPAIQRLRATFPEAEITVLAAAASAELAALEPSIDRVLEFNFFHPRSAKGRLPSAAAALAALRSSLAPEHFDLAIDLRRQADTRPILQATGARWLAGFEQDHAHPWLDIAVPFEGDIALHARREHVADALIALIDAVAAQCSPDRRIVRHVPDRAPGLAILKPLLDAWAPPGPLVCVHTGAGSPNKQWPARSFAALIDLLAGACGAGILLIGGPDEAAFARSVLRQLQRAASVRDLVGRIGLRDLPAVLRAADLYIGNDSGPKHIAAALGVPTIGVHSGTVDATEWGAIGPLALTIRREMTCSPCYLMRAEDCPRALACLDGIRVSDVFAACRRMLALAAIP